MNLIMIKYNSSLSRAGYKMKLNEDKFYKSESHGTKRSGIHILFLC